MTSLDIQCETFSATGNISGRGIQKILGTPNLDRLRIVIRETVQNTWDARLEDNGATRYQARIRKLTPNQRNFLLHSLLADMPPSGSARSDLKLLREKEAIHVLEISDFGTTGLGGPVRANVAESRGETRNFVDFFRNIGSPRDTHHGGGTYGYGKSSIYMMSSCRTVFAYTRTRTAGKPVSRFLGAAISNPFTHGRTRYTGRYWWGEKRNDHVVDPIEGKAADRLSNSIGMPDRSADEFGTTLLIIDPNFEHRTREQAAEAIRQSLLWYFWPKMIPQKSRRPAMDFEVGLDDTSLDIPALKDCPPLAAFVEAYAQTKRENAGFNIECQKPVQMLGRLGLAKVPLRPRRSFDTGDDTPLLPERSCHIALMRPAELVVKYLEGPPLPSESIEYGGVFICDEEVEEAFAAAEPPAHDDWIPDNLTGWEKTFVRVALRRVRDKVTEQIAPKQEVIANGQSTPLGAFGDALGGLLLGQTGQGLSVNAFSNRKTGRKGHGGIQIGRAKPFGFSTVKNIQCALFKIEISGSQSNSLSLSGKAQVVVEGGAATSEPAGVSPPEVVAWLDTKGNMLAKGSLIRLDSVTPMSLFAAVSIPRNCAVAVDVTEII